MTYRVVQWTTGNVGKKSVHAITANTELDLVGCYAWSADKVGRDVGELCGIDPLGIAATDDVDALLALGPDCVVYNPMFADVDDLVRILEAGINVVTTSEFIDGTCLCAGRDRVVDACERGGATIFGSGINPGFIQLFAIVTAGISDRVDRISIVESFDTTIYNSPATEIPMGFGYPIGHPELQAVTEKGSGIFREAVLLVADALGVDLDGVRCQADYAQTTEDLLLPGDWTIAAGCVAGIDVRWTGLVGDRQIIEVRGVWTKGQTLEPVWSPSFGYTITVEGRPTIKSTLSFEPPPDFVGETLDDFVMLGLTITAMPAITAIPAVVAAPPGIATYTDLPLLLPRGVLTTTPPRS
ncbi:dihydrodipicolinate reductase [Mycolicibacterium duvalii]|uniref:Dihydrodipicolinate reductase n=1 Tax=Mycolicibacterium duvalii TaxID=39688 RepID=A0A7I7KA26_9MYCO|nr:dihydrodipicolinate reductase [Mycolicibacterium duvalii]MCV7366510.1 dihydrodipicolinate reductase [Mycolicibacterium duvalii]PEG43709.1 dihydrodipicolinate reductase [Mycolicibacterium duvalii]BBX20338.1 dihydrodipicolinate reductase [Mycolicibacterium duvalii]